MDKVIGKLQPAIGFLRRYIVLLVVAGAGLVYGYLIYTSGQLAQVEPDEKTISEKYQGIKRPKLSDEVKSRLSELEDNNIQFQILIDEARRNPFLEE